MSRENTKKIKYCVYCGVDVAKNKTYCPNCGKLVVKLKEGEQQAKQHITPKPDTMKKVDISRKCPGCGSVITSTILDQCPICNAALEKIPEAQKVAIKKKPAFIFTNKKLRPEQNFILKKDEWNLKEGINVFSTCVYIYIISFFLIYFFLVFQGDGDSIDQTIQMFIISQIPEVLIAIYPIYYVISKNHSYTKLGFERDPKKVLKAVVIGLVGAFSLLLLNLLYNTLISSLADIGLDFFGMEVDLILQNQVIQNADLIWVILLVILIALGAASLEIVYRGVLHNALKQRFRNEIYVILIVALVYSVFMVLIYPNPTFFLLNFLGFVILGIIWEVSNGNIYSTLIASVLYSILPIILILF
ncbi:MAG: CPBP family intramembrane metalloprotease [Candidatus Lokiarchaeota archaeon]|nr:CPBP family intramembrane metalloprotease [Candidatus Lokiarchaeota archaeon]